MAAVVVGTGVVGTGVVVANLVVVGTGVVVANLVVVGAAAPSQDVRDFVKPVLQAKGQLFATLPPAPVKYPFGMLVQPAVETHPAAQIISNSY